MEPFDNASTSLSADRQAQHDITQDKLATSVQ